MEAKKNQGLDPFIQSLKQDYKCLLEFLPFESNRDRSEANIRGPAGERVTELWLFVS